ncbi:MAG TPA: hypothetical protein VJZ00_06465 [Thermoanaerobaculia bacterium]|nr:hypothetical protein [Thermoanaerobaculia bacterium]
MDADDIRRWVENHRAAADRVAAEARKAPLTPSESFAHAMALLRFDETINGDPFSREDPVTAREDEQMWTMWTRLRRGWSGDR